jgi:hypothetical protein
MDKPFLRSPNYPTSGPTTPSIQHLKRFKIHFDNKGDKQIGSYILITSGIPVTNIGDGMYIVNSAQLDILKNNHIHYNIDK